MRYLAAALVLLSVLVCPPVAASQTPRPFVFGMNFINMNDKTCRIAKEAGCTSIRVGLGWDGCEHTPGVYDFSRPDRDVNMGLKYGFEPFFLIVATPSFYLREDQRDKVWAWPALPEFYPQATKFYKAVAEHFKGRVKYYEFWNEENGWGWHDGGTPAEYGAILKVAYQAMKEGDPNCQVAVGGLDGANRGYYQYVQKLYDSGYGKYFDAVTVHPYRSDGPIDTVGIKNTYQVMKDHGDGDKKIWITEYGWSKKYGHDLKARWLKESLDLLTSPGMDCVFQASVHVLDDFDESEYGLCDSNLNPRPGYYVFKNYPKDWKTVEQLQSAPKPQNYAKVSYDSLELTNDWTYFGDGFNWCDASSVDIIPEAGKKIFVVVANKRALSGGAYRTIETAPGVPVIAETRVWTTQHGEVAENSEARTGIDPTGGTDPKSSAIVWGRWRNTSEVWDDAGVGRVAPVIPKGNKVTVFLQYKHDNGCLGQVTAFDNIRITAQKDTFKLPKMPQVKK